MEWAGQSSVHYQGSVLLVSSTLFLIVLALTPAYVSWAWAASSARRIRVEQLTLPRVSAGVIGQVYFLVPYVKLNKQ